MRRKAKKQRLNGPALAALALLCFCGPAFAEGSGASVVYGRPQASLDQPKAPDFGGPDSEATNQADAFDTAAEQATYLGAYQMFYGPYGRSSDPEKRNKLLKETAAAIDECLQGCSEEKQQIVLKAISQYKLGQDIQRMMLENRTNRELMRTPSNAGDPYAKARGEAILDPTVIDNALHHGREFAVDPKGIRPAKTWKKSEISRGTGSNLPEYYQLDDAQANYNIDAKYLREREILGEQFLKDYAVFLDDFNKSDGSDKTRFYKYVPAKNDSERYVYARNPDGSYAIDSDRLEAEKATESEQNNPKIQEAMVNYRKNLKAIHGHKNADDKVELTGEGSNPRDLGFGETTDIDFDQVKGVNFDDLKEDGKIPLRNESRAVARLVNKAFKDAADEGRKKRLTNSGSSRTPASDDGQKWQNHIVLSPKDFGEFLNEIWPDAAKRKELEQGQANNPRALN